MDNDGRNAIQLTDGKVIDDIESISADGTFLLFSRSPLSSGMGRAANAYVMKIGSGKNTAVRVGETAIFDSDAKHVLSCEAGKLCRVDFADAKLSRQALNVNAFPSDVSKNGERILLRRYITGEGVWEFFVLDRNRNSESTLGRGYNALFLDEQGSSAMVTTLVDQFVVSVKSGNRKPVNPPMNRKTTAYVPAAMRGHVVFARDDGGDSMEVISYDAARDRLDVIATLNCSVTRFDGVRNSNAR